MTLDSSNIGCKYKRAAVLGFENYMRAVYHDRAKNEYFVFFNLVGDFDNKLDTNGLTIELSKPTNWKAPTPVKTERQHVFVRVGDTGKFTYIGVSERQVLDAKTNKVHLEMTVRGDVLKELTEAEAAAQKRTIRQNVVMSQ
jgi:hypothetical protein